MRFMLWVPFYVEINLSDHNLKVFMSIASTLSLVPIALMMKHGPPHSLPSFMLDLETLGSNIVTLLGGQPSAKWIQI